MENKNVDNDSNLIDLKTNTNENDSIITTNELTQEELDYYSDMLENFNLLNDKVEFVSLSLILIMGLFIGFIFIKGVFDNWKI